MFILIDNDNVILESSSFYEEVENGYLLGGSIFPRHQGSVIEIEGDSLLPSRKYIYSNGSLIENPIYKERKDIAIQEAIDSFTLELIEGGLL